jgi:two-component sensor histidine kinase
LALLSKDAMIREIHHRVKNNLQTVAALLRLQARRVVAPEARVALEDSMRRIDSIALVHETLSVSVNESVEFDDIVDRLLPMLADVTDSKDRVAVRRVGSFGSVPAETATSLVLVLTEVVQNATEHAFGDQLSGAVTVEVRRDGPQLMMRIIDDGAGLPPGFAIDASDRLGLQIVRTLISAELGGSFEIAARQDDLRGTEVVVSLTVADGDTVAK